MQGLGSDTHIAQRGTEIIPDRLANAFERTHSLVGTFSKTEA